MALSGILNSFLFEISMNTAMSSADTSMRVHTIVPLSKPCAVRMRTKTPMEPQQTPAINGRIATILSVFIFDRP